MMKTGNSNENEIFQYRMNAFNEHISLYPEKLFADLELDLNEEGEKYLGACPIHDGDNENAFNLYPQGHTMKGFWKCRSQHCDEYFVRNYIGLTRGVFSGRNGWKTKDKRQSQFPFKDIMKYLSNLYEFDPNSVQVDHEKIFRMKFMSEIQKTYEKPQGKGSRESVRDRLYIPSQYFLDRGFSSEVLDEFDVGWPKNEKLEFKDRVIAPIYDEQEKYMGATCRSVFEKCPQCKLFHNPSEKCPEKEYRGIYTKWRNIGFDSSKNLYGFWKARNQIEETHTAVLVEGPGDLWKMKEAGIHNVVAIFGSTLHDDQEFLLSQSQAMSLVIMLDNDEAGQRAAETIRDQYNRLYRLYFPKFTEKDVGELRSDTITKDILPLIRRIENIERTECIE